MLVSDSVDQSASLLSSPLACPTGAVKLATLCAMWYTVSASNGIVSKTVLTSFNWPITVTLVQLATISVCSPPCLTLFRVRPMPEVSWRIFIRFILPLAAMKVFASTFAHFSIANVPVSYSHTVRAGMPFFTIVLSRIFLGRRFSAAVYCSLVPVVIGIALSSANEMHFNAFGLAAAVASTAGFSSMTIMTKCLTDDVAIHSQRLLVHLSRHALVLLCPVWLIVDLPGIVGDINNGTASLSSVAHLLLLTGLLHWVQNLIAFAIMQRTSALSYAVANVTKRIAVIVFSVWFFRNHVTAVNGFGIALAIGGVYAYVVVQTRAKGHYQPQQSQLILTRDRAYVSNSYNTNTVLPLRYVTSSSDLYNASGKSFNSSSDDSSNGEGSPTLAGSSKQRRLGSAVKIFIDKDDERRTLALSDDNTISNTTVISDDGNTAHLHARLGDGNMMSTDCASVPTTINVSA